jgi:hypothetical protein
MRTIKLCLSLGTLALVCAALGCAAEIVSEPTVAPTNTSAAMAGDGGRPPQHPPSGGSVSGGTNGVTEN